jgi:hypothetical protein
MYQQNIGFQSFAWMKHERSRYFYSRGASPTIHRRKGPLRKDAANVEPFGDLILMACVSCTQTSRTAEAAVSNLSAPRMALSTRAATRIDGTD